MIVGLIWKVIVIFTVGLIQRPELQTKLIIIFYFDKQKTL